VEDGEAVLRGRQQSSLASPRPTRIEPDASSFGDLADRGDRRGRLAPQFLKDERTTQVLDLTADFNNAKACYTTISNNLKNKPSNTKFTVEFLGLHVECDGTSSEYVLNVDASVINGITWWTVAPSCNFAANWIINIGGGDVTFNGDNFPGISGGIVYNIH